MSKKNKKEDSDYEDAPDNEEDFEINENELEDELEDELEEDEYKDEDNEDNDNDNDDNDEYENDNNFDIDNENIKHKLEIEGKECLIGNNRISHNKLTKYEMVRILGERTKQLTMGAKPLIKNYKGIPYEKIAEEELLKNILPFKIKRFLPNGKYEIWTLDELNKEHLLFLLD